MIERDPLCADVSVAEHDSPVLALTVAEPVGPTPVPATENVTITACCSVEGFGVLELMVTVLVALAAVVLCVRGEGVEKVESAAHVAVRVHVPVPLVMVTPAVALAGVPLTAPTVQTLVVPVICGMVLALVVAVTVKLVL